MKYRVFNIRHGETFQKKTFNSKIIFLITFSENDTDAEASLT